LHFEINEQTAVSYVPVQSSHKPALSLHVSTTSSTFHFPPVLVAPHFFTSNSLPCRVLENHQKMIWIKSNQNRYQKMI